MDPDLSISKIPGIGKYYEYKLRKLNINTVEDLIYHFPFRYDDFSQIKTIDNIQTGETVSIQGVIWQIKNVRTRSGKFVTVATVADQSGTVEIVWFNQPYLTQTLKPGIQISLSGKIQFDGFRPKLISPSYEIIKSVASQSRSDLEQVEQGLTLHTGRLVPIYPETEGVSSKWLRAKIAKILPEYLKKTGDFVPKQIRDRQKLTNLTNALNCIHFPKSQVEIDKATKRLAFDELFLIQLASQLRKLNWQKTKTAPKMKIDDEKFAKFIQILPFHLTSAQKRAIDEFLSDLKKDTPANRLLEGDVASGKTVVAAAAIFVAHVNGYSSLVAAPTEILAFQHQETLTKILSIHGMTVGIWTASRKQKGDVTIGTHALLNNFKPEKTPGLVVVDEQHRFGVAQRGRLFIDQSGKLTPHLLTMTATPIPRTLALTLYGDLDLSILDEMPIGRQKIATFVVPSAKRNKAYKFIEEQVESGRQAFIITPFVEPSETMISVKAATIEFEKLKKIFAASYSSSERSESRSPLNSSRQARTIRLGLLHGKLKSKEKESAVGKFQKGAIDILVATPVVEVGIDIPNATIMMIESAERFGLAQLHQLRGRVGRGKHKSYCFLFTDSSSPTSLRRLRSMEKIEIGFELAEIDLKMRGSGEIFGLRQSGFVNLKMADLADRKAVSEAQNEAKELLAADSSLAKFPLLAQKLNKLQSEYIQPN